MSEKVTIENPRFGVLSVESEGLICFDGLPGFPDLRRFAVVQHDRQSPFGWLLSVERPELAFPVTDPREFFPGYRPTLGESQLRALAAEPSEQLEWLAIGRVGEGRVSLNLAAPLVINPRNRRGIQAILEEGGWSTREPLPVVSQSAKAGDPTESAKAGDPTEPAKADDQTESKPPTKRGQGSRAPSARR